MSSVKKGILRNFAKFTGKCLCLSFLIKDTLALVFSGESFEIPKNIFFIELIWATASGFKKNLSLNMVQK